MPNYRPFAILQVMKLAWNIDSTVLATWLQSIDSNSSRFECYLCIWTMANYHWYMKKCLDCSCNKNEPDGRLCHFLWDPNEALRIHLVRHCGTHETLDFCWNVGRVTGAQSSDRTACAVVVDGDSLLITEFAKFVIPPPMAGATIRLNGFVNYVFIDALAERIFAAVHNGNVAILHKEKDEWAVERIFSFTSCADANVTYKYGAFGDDIITVSCSLSVDSINGRSYQVNFWKMQDESNLCLKKQTWNFDSPICNLFTVPSENSCIISTENGCVMMLKNGGETVQLMSNLCGDQIKLTGICCEFSAITIDGKGFFILSRNSRNQLFIDGKEVANNVNSYLVHDGEYLLVTTLTHKLLCIRLSDVICAGFSLSAIMANARNVERGSRLVVTAPDQMKVVLQMPRGNLETIFPRELILRVVKSLLDDRQYKKCTAIMKRHRLNTNLICDHDFMKFLENIDLFTDSVDDTLMLNIFLSELKSENVTRTFYHLYYDTTNDGTSCSRPRKINEICIKMRESLKRPKCFNGKKHFTSLLTTYIKMDPPDFDNALLLIKKCRDESGDTKLVYEGLRHLLYLVDVNILIDVALGTYDFDLVLMVIEKSQKDPKEFLPFLNELKSLEPSYRMYKIDSHLRQYGKALKHLVECGETKFDECLQFIKQHKLFVEALELFERTSEAYKSICELYAEFLTNESRFVDSGIFYELAEKFECAALCYTKTTDPAWFLSISNAQKVSPEKIVSLGHVMGQKLRDSRKFKEASEIFLTVLRDVVTAIDCLLEGHFYVEAYMMIMQENKTECVESALKPALKKYLSENCSHIDKHRLMYEKYTNRLKIVRSCKKDKLNKTVCNGDYHIDDDTYSEIGSTVSGISTRLSTKASTNARAKRVLAKKEEKKRHVLKENSPYEDLALLNALNEIVRQVEELQNELPRGLKLSVLVGLHNEGRLLQIELKKLVTLIESSMDTIWPLTVDLTTIPGPLGENVSVLMGDNDFSVADKANATRLLCTSNAAIKIDPLIIRPRLTVDFNWLVDFYMG